MPPKSIRPEPQKHHHRWRIVVLVLIVYVLFAALRPLPALKPDRSSAQLNIATTARTIPWPNSGGAAIGLSDGTLLATHGDDSPLPTASTIKVFTALMVLKKHPLAKDQTGPTITLDATDVGYYQSYVSQGGSVEPVYAGETLTEYEALQAMLLPSANNVADSLARWAYGSLTAYKTAAQAYANQLGLTNTTIGSDASGLAPDSVSSPTDLYKIGSLALQNPALAEIVAQPSAYLPDFGTVTNYNSLLGEHGITGIKTGNSDQAGGVFIGSAKTTVNGKQITLITAITGANSLDDVLAKSSALITGAEDNFAVTSVIHAGDVLGSYKTPWGGEVEAVAAKDLQATSWQGGTVHANFNLKKISVHAKAGSVIGTASAPQSDFDSGRSISLVLKQAPTQPSFGWRLLHP